MSVYYFSDPIPIVDRYPYLGVTLDVALTLEPHLRAVIACGWPSFNSLLGAAYCHGLPMQLMASTIPSR
eukprot:4272952-Karenia_brevis.AAC.1